MLGNFQNCFTRDTEPVQTSKEGRFGRIKDTSLQEFLAYFGGVSFNRGLYRFMTPLIFGLAEEFITEAFSAISGSLTGFSYDWLGRIFALDNRRLEAGCPAVLMMEPGTGQVLQIPANLISFHDHELIDFPDASLAVEFYDQWLASGGKTPRTNECVGYLKPLFLGGKDTLDNLAISDLDVYWSISAQLINKTRQLPIGTRIKEVRIEP